MEFPTTDFYPRALRVALENTPTCHHQIRFSAQSCTANSRPPQPFFGLGKSENLRCIYINTHFFSKHPLTKHQPSLKASTTVLKDPLVKRQPLFKEVAMPEKVLATLLHPHSLYIRAIHNRCAANVDCRIKIYRAFCTDRGRPGTKTERCLRSKTRMMSSYASTTSACAGAMYAPSYFPDCHFFFSLCTIILPLLTTYSFPRTVSCETMTSSSPSRPPSTTKTPHPH